MCSCRLSQVFLHTHTHTQTCTHKRTCSHRVSQVCLYVCGRVRLSPCLSVPKSVPLLSPSPSLPPPSRIPSGGLLPPPARKPSLQHLELLLPLLSTLASLATRPAADATSTTAATPSSVRQGVRGGDRVDEGEAWSWQRGGDLLAGVPALDSETQARATMLSRRILMGVAQELGRRNAPRMVAAISGACLSGVCLWPSAVGGSVCVVGRGRRYEHCFVY